MPSNLEQFRNYVFGAADEQELIAMYHQAYKNDFVNTLEKVFDEYGLADRLKGTNSESSPALILDVGCANGIYLHTVAELLEKKDLLNTANLIGIDLNETAIANAEKFCLAAKPPRPYLQFYLYDATQPLEDCSSLRLQNKLKFDLIYALRFASFTSNARQNIKQLYKALKPGGVIYLYDVVAKPGEEGWIAPPPMVPMVEALFKYFASLNGGIGVGTEAANWLKAAGAEMVQTGVKRHSTGGNSQEVRQFLRFWVITFHTAGPMLVKKGFLTQAQYEEAMSRTYRELNPYLHGQLTFGYTLARKPV